MEAYFLAAVAAGFLAGVSDDSFLVGVSGASPRVVPTPR